MAADEIDTQGHKKEGNTPKRVSVPFQGSRIAPFLRSLGTQTGGLCVSAPDPRPCISKEPPHPAGYALGREVVGTYSL